MTEGIETDLSLEEENKKLIRENKHLTRELERQRSINKRSQINAEANANLNMIVTKEKSRLEQYMNLLLTNCPDIILLFDREGKIVYASDSFLRNSNISAESLIRGKTLRDLLTPYVNEVFLDHIDGLFQRTLVEMLRSETDSEIDFGLGGGKRHFIIQITPMIGDNNQIEGAMAILYDTTELARARDEAERARQLAEQSTKFKSEFLSRMSHEMRTPLNAIIGMSGIAQRTSDITRIQYSLTKVNEASQHLLGVINDILDISKIEAGKFDLVYDEFDFEKMLQRVINVNNFRVEEKHQQLMVHIDPNIPPFLIGDDQRLAQVLTNLLSNAIKFTDDNGFITINATHLDVIDDNNIILFEVIDTGIGITEEQISRLFKNFEQADGSTSRKYGGTGLGLAICKHIIEMMDGKIWVESDYGKGSAFKFEIPLKKGNGITKKLLRNDINLHNLRILAVDDSPEVIDYMKLLMNRNNILIDTASNAEEALVKISQNKPYDIYFIDWFMPGMNGIDLSKRIKQSDILRHSIVIMISSTDWDRIAKEAKSVGVNRFLSKPLFPSDIFDCINECLGTEITKTDPVEKIEMDVFEGYRILLAEDIDINREIIITLLEPTLLKIDCAVNGKEALEFFRAAPDDYDLIFMDVQMPLMDGLEATQRIRNLNIPKAKTIPIIAMTSNVFREDVEKCLAAGMSGHVGKPIDIKEVLTQLHKYLEVNKNFIKEELIQYEQGLARIMGNEKMYKRLLGIFLKDPNIAALEEAVKSGNIEKAAESSHAIKGIAGNLSLGPLYNIVTAFHSELKSGKLNHTTSELYFSTLKATVQAVQNLLQ